MLPTTLDVTGLIKTTFETALGAGADVFYTEGGAAIEVAASSADPVVEVQDKPKLQFWLADTPDAECSFGGDSRERIIKSKDTTALTFVDAPAAKLVDLVYQVVGWSVREFDSTEGARSFTWLLEKLRNPSLNNFYLLGSGWDLDQADSRGYLVQWTAAPKRTPGAASSLHVLSATLVVRRFRLNDASYATGSLVGTVNFDPALLVP